MEHHKDSDLRNSPSSETSSFGARWRCSQELSRKPTCIEAVICTVIFRRGLGGGKKTNMTETSDISKAQTSENQLNQPNQLIAFDANNSMQEKEIKGQVEKSLQAGLIKVKNVKNLRGRLFRWSLKLTHHPETNGKNERVNQSLVTRLKCKVNASSTKIPWAKLLDQVCNECNSTPHSIIKYPPAYLLFGLLPYHSPIDQNNYYEPVDEARESTL
ncbi:retrovirus-related Pol polyprotein from transposon 17.6 [Trichonephila clavipes]|nr:retrovirus-related Pol polyprotein from transposon 17.6 [Trichonephila clavipes]